MSKPFILPKHRQRPAKPTPPSPFRLFIVPDDGKPRLMECPRKIQTLQGAMTHARSFAADCGVAGRIEVHERVGAMWLQRRTATVKSSHVVAWRVD